MDGYEIVQHVVFHLHDAASQDGHGGDDVLDQGLGSAVLRDPACADLVSRALLHHDVERYRLHAWCVMPNHVHVLLTTFSDYELGAIVRSWKTFSARRINAYLGREGRLWAPDYFDRYTRDETHFQTAKRYIEMNPVAAGLCAAPQDWRFSSAGWKG